MRYVVRGAATGRVKGHRRAALGRANEKAVAAAEDFWGARGRVRMMA